MIKMIQNEAFLSIFDNFPLIFHRNFKCDKLSFFFENIQSPRNSPFSAGRARGRFYLASLAFGVVFSEKSISDIDSSDFECRWFQPSSLSL